MVSNAELVLAQDFMKKIIDGFEVDTELKFVRVGLVTYSNIGRARFEIGDHTSDVDLKNKYV